ncbi:hypothetical protein OV203_26385 [Nannocystis sp. ILAH1]|uniref:hypothetical protein n=1 Tax=Nannocystis sp. ILAH1 TaxID=2996789 RepID=UPI00226ED727|nr:hypothetical protein [Nannocystis sp. ILAH1]MCY0990700.1 hypothetical protein [Nannocystis sp. ILAH1]
MPIELVLLTTNGRKADEWRRNFDRYGIAVRAVAAAATAETARALIEAAPAGVRVIAVCREDSDLFVHGTDIRSERHDLELVDHVTAIVAWFMEDGELREAHYRHRAEGFVDRSDGACEEPGGWWDAIFRLRATGSTYAEMRGGRGQAVVARHGDLAVPARPRLL